MFPEKQRLPSILVGNVIRQGKRVSANGCEIRMLASINPVSRFAVVVPVSTHKQAVKRNYVRRCIRESIRHLAVTITSPYDFVCFGRKECVGKTQQEIAEILTKLFEKFNSKINL